MNKDRKYTELNLDELTAVTGGKLSGESVQWLFLNWGKIMAHADELVGENGNLEAFFQGLSDMPMDLSADMLKEYLLMTMQRNRMLQKSGKFEKL